MATRRGQDRPPQYRPEEGPAEDEIGECSSPPCFLHEIDPAYAGLDIPAPAPAYAKTPKRDGGRS